ncbi:unnamed protein product [Cochlearia groenlandica]
MADFGYFSDTDDSAVEDLISQANDLSALEQIAAINCSAFTTDSSSLPVDIESRFRRLKSLPNPSPDPMINNNNNKKKKKHLSQSKTVTAYPKEDRDPGLKSDDESVDLSDSRESNNNNFSSSAKQSEKKLLRIKSSSSFSSIDLATPPRSSDSEARSKKSKHKSSLRSLLFNKLSSPSKIIGLIWRSQKKLSKTETTKSVKSFSCEGDVDFDEFLSDLNAYSLEDQKKMLKKAMEEQQKMRKEAASIIKLKNKASAKFDFY